MGPPLHVSSITSTSGKMGEAAGKAGERAGKLTAHDRLDEDFYCTVYCELKRKGFAVEIPDNQQVYSERRLKESNRCGFSITSERRASVVWKVPERDAAMSGLIKEILQNPKPINTWQVSEAFDPLIIDIMVDFMTWGAYRLRDPLRIHYALDRVSDINKNLAHNIDNTKPILIHYGVFHISKSMEFPELTADALQHINFILTRRSMPVAIEVFENLVSKVWGVTMDVYDDHDVFLLRRMLAMYGVIVGPIWAQQNNKLLTELRDLDDKYKKYAKWHAQTSEVVQERSDYEIAPFVRGFLRKGKKYVKGTEF